MTAAPATGFRRTPFIVVGLVLLAMAVAIVAFVLLADGWWPGNEGADADSSASPIQYDNAPNPRIEALEAQIDKRSTDLDAHIELASLYLQRVRETGDPAHYAKAESLIRSASKLDPMNGDVFALDAQLALGRHDFASALTLANKALITDPERALFLGLRADAQVELGKYPEALKSLQGMVDLRPDFAAFSRVAYLRELHGDPEGAVEAMEFAIEARTGVPENMAWAHVQLGNLLLGLGPVDEASQSYERAQTLYPGYAEAFAGEARIAVARGDLDAAAGLYERAFNRTPLPQYAIALGDVYTVAGDTGRAKQQYDLVTIIDRLQRENGLNTDLDSALFLADHRLDLGDAVSRARAAYAAAPSVHAADALAWALFQSGDATAAEPYSDEALRLGSRDASKLYHAAMIKRALGKTNEAREWLQFVANTHPAFSILHAESARKALAELGPASAASAR